MIPFAAKPDDQKYLCLMIPFETTFGFFERFKLVASFAQRLRIGNILAPTFAERLYMIPLRRQRCHSVLKALNAQRILLK